MSARVASTKAKHATHAKAVGFAIGVKNGFEPTVRTEASFECMVGEKEVEGFQCKFLANEADREKIVRAREVF